MMGCISLDGYGVSGQLRGISLAMLNRTDRTEIMTDDG